MVRSELPATCLLLGLAFAFEPQAKSRPAEISQAEIDAAVDRGVAHLLALHAEDDARDAGPPRSLQALPDRPGLRALTVYALLKSGVDGRNPVVEKLLARLAYDRFDGTYDAACMVLALCALDPSRNRGWIDELATDLLRWRTDSGEFGYPAGEGDLSNTQYGALALRSAAAAGFEVPAGAWIGVARAVLRHQTREGGFDYIAGGRRHTNGAMTVAGIGTLAICEERLAAASALPSDLEEPLRRARSDGFAWLRKHFAVDKNPEYGAFTHYYLYGLERAGALTGVDRIGDHEWFREGAAYLLSTQLGDGSWAGTFRGEAAPFALLFLRRATATRGPRTGELVDRTPAVRATPDDRTGVDPVVRVGAAGSSPLLLWIHGLSGPSNASLEWPGERYAGPRVLRVEYFGDGRAIAAALGDPDHPARERRFLVEDRSLPPGRHRVFARVHVRPPPAHDSLDPSSRVLVSDEVDVEVGAAPAPAPAHEEATSPRGPNLLADARPKASASSVLPDASNRSAMGFAAQCAVDGNPRSPWIAAVGDEFPLLRVTLPSTLRANRIRVMPAILFPRSPDFLTRALAVSIRVNGGPNHEAHFPGDGVDGVEIRLEKTADIQSLELRLLGREVADKAVGIGEIELRLAPD